jgi:hypothetical protein
MYGIVPIPKSPKNKTQVMDIKLIHKKDLSNLSILLSNLSLNSNNSIFGRAIDESKLSVKGVHIYVCSAIDIDSGELLALEAFYCRNCLNALIFLKKALKMCVRTSLYSYL